MPPSHPRAPQADGSDGAAFPAWAPGAFVCMTELRVMRAGCVESFLEAERGELTALDREVIASLAALQPPIIMMSQRYQGPAAQRK